MNTATQNLENDHINILRLIDVMEKMIMVKSNNIGHFENVVNVIKSFADNYHHSKEENLLFPLLVTKGFAKEQGPIAVMLHDHTEGRNFVKGMVEQLMSYKDGNAKALVELYENMHGYIVLLRNHIAKENNVLFRMADNALSEKEQLELLKEFAEVEKGLYCGGELKDCIVAIENLESFYN